MGAQLRVDAVGADHHVGFRDGAVCEANARARLVLLESDRAVAGAHDSGRQVRGEELDKIRAVHAEARVPAGGVGDLDGRDRRAIVAKVRRARADARAVAFYGRPEADALQLPHRIRRDVHAGAHLAERGRLLVERDGDAVCEERIGGEEASDAAADDQDARRRCHTPLLRGYSITRIAHKVCPDCRNFGAAGTIVPTMARASVGRSVLQRLERKVGGSNSLAERLGVRPTLMRRFLAGTLEVPDVVLVRALDLLAEAKRREDEQ